MLASGPGQGSRMTAAGGSAVQEALRAAQAPSSGLDPAGALALHGITGPPGVQQHAWAGAAALTGTVSHAHVAGATSNARCATTARAAVSIARRRIGGRLGMRQVSGHVAECASSRLRGRVPGAGAGCDRGSAAMFGLHRAANTYWQVFDVTKSARQGSAC